MRIIQHTGRVLVNPVITDYNYSNTCRQNIDHRKNTVLLDPPPPLAVHLDLTAEQNSGEILDYEVKCPEM